MEKTVFDSDVKGSIFKEYAILKLKNKLIEELERKNPILKEAYEVLGIEGITETGFNEERIKEKLSLISYNDAVTISEKLLDCFMNEFSDISDVEAELGKAFKALNINGLKPKIGVIKHSHFKNLINVNIDFRFIRNRFNEGVFIYPVDIKY